MKNNKQPTFETTWRNKWTTSNATNIDQMIGALMRSIEELQEMKKDGIEGEFESASDDYIFFRTHDPVLAEKYGMHEEEAWDEEFDDDDLDEIDEDMIGN